MIINLFYVIDFLKIFQSLNILLLIIIINKS